jgi:DNA-binding CsgD family transcriptional regulator
LVIKRANADNALIVHGIYVMIRAGRASGEYGGNTGVFPGRIFRIKAHPRLAARQLDRLRSGGPAMAKAADVKVKGDPAALRRTGILPLDLLPWGAHICLFYETPEDLIDANVGYFRAGLADNEYCLWALSDEIGRVQAIAALRETIADFDDHLAGGAIELVPGGDWYHGADAFDLKRNMGSLDAKLNEALSRGFVGIRASGYAFWMKSQHWRAFRQYEEALDNWLAGKPMIGLCTYKLGASWAANLLDVARVHHFSIVMRDGNWEYLEDPERGTARREDGPLSGGTIDVASRPFPGHDRLSPRERATLTQIVNGASSKEAARALGISPRTVEFHRANIMSKLDARNVAELVGMVFGTG